jgi:LacI family transcriptional regulator
LTNLSSQIVAGRRVPDDVSLIGFDDLPSSTDTTPALTTIRLDLESMGEQAMRLVVTDRPETEDGIPVRQLLHAPATLVVRESTGPAATR